MIAANREEEAREIVRLHNWRGQVENFIKEIKDGFGMDWMPCGETYANAVFFRIGVIAYNLFIAMKLLALPPWYRHHLNSKVASLPDSRGSSKACPSATTQAKSSARQDNPFSQVSVAVL